MAEPIDTLAMRTWCGESGDCLGRIWSLNGNACQVSSWRFTNALAEMQKDWLTFSNSEGKAAYLIWSAATLLDGVEKGFSKKVCA